MIARKRKRMVTVWVALVVSTPTAQFGSFSFYGKLGAISAKRWATRGSLHKIRIPYAEAKRRGLV